MKFELTVTATAEIDEQFLKNAISNSLFSEYLKNKKRISEMTLYELSSYLPDIIGNEILNDIKHILIMNDWGLPQ